MKKSLIALTLIAIACSACNGGGRLVHNHGLRSWLYRLAGFFGFGGCFFDRRFFGSDGFFCDCLGRGGSGRRAGRKGNGQGDERVFHEGHTMKGQGSLIIARNGEMCMRRCIRVNPGSTGSQTDGVGINHVAAYQGVCGGCGAAPCPENSAWTPQGSALPVACARSSTCQ